MKLSERMRAYLTEIARRRGTIRYRDFAKVLDVQPPHTIRQVTDALELLMREDYVDEAPFLAALVVSKVRNGLPAPPFFSLARALGRYTGSDTSPESLTYHTCELKRAWDRWGRLT